MSKPIYEGWDGSQVELTFRQNFTIEMMELWYQLVEITQAITLTDESSALI